MSVEAQPNENVSGATGSPTGRRYRKTDYHKGMDATALALSISNHLKYTLAKHPEGATLHDQYWSAASAIRDRLVDLQEGTELRRILALGEGVVVVHRAVPTSGLEDQ